MKLINAREQWMFEGMVLGLIHKTKGLSADEMQAYYAGIAPGTVIYKQLRAPSQYDRTVLLGSNARFYIIPMTPDIQIIETEGKQ